MECVLLFSYSTVYRKSTVLSDILTAFLITMMAGYSLSEKSAVAISFTMNLWAFDRMYVICMEFKTQRKTVTDTCTYNHASNYSIVIEMVTITILYCIFSNFSISYAFRLREKKNYIIFGLKCICLKICILHGFLSKKLILLITEFNLLIHDLKEIIKYLR